MKENLSHEEWKSMLKKLPMIAADAAVFRNNKILLIRRNIKPFKGDWALPGGFLNYNETLKACAERETKEETGLSVSIGELVGIYDDLKRDPRGRVIAVCFLAEVAGGTLKADPKEVSDVNFFDKLPTNIAEPHRIIIQDAFKKHESL